MGSMDCHHRQINKSPNILFLFFRSLMLFALIGSVSAAGVCIKVERANLRSGPGAGYKKSWEVFRHMPFHEIGRKGKWVEVEDVDGDKHWVFENLITSDYLCAVIKVDKANLRTGPGTEYKPHSLYPSAEKYESFKYLQKKDKWVELEDVFGNHVWIFRTLIWVQ